MTSTISNKLSAGERTVEFNHANPFESEGEQKVGQTLAELVGTGRTLLQQVRAGESDAEEATAERRTLMERMVFELLRPLATVGANAAGEVPELAQLRRAPARKASLQSFRTAAEAMSALATRHREALERHGMAPTLPEDLVAALARFEQLNQRVHAGTRAHIGARAELRDVGRRLTAILRQLDGMNMYRFRNDPERRAAWRAAKRVSWPQATEEKGGSTEAA